MLCCGLLSSRMAAVSFHNLYRFAFWVFFGSHVLQSIQSLCGSFVTSICIQFDVFAF